MFPTLGQVGPFSFPTYTILIDAGIAAALAWLYFTAPAGRGTRRLDAGLAATVGAFTGARLLYIIIHGDYYLPHLEEIFRFWQGGLSWPGAVAGGLLGAGWLARRRHEPLAAVLDAGALPIALLGLLGWGGCLAAGCAYGYEAPPGAWLATQAPDLYGLTLPRFPTQLFGLGWSVLALALVALTPRRAWRSGARGALALALVALGMFALAFTRGDPAPLIGGTRGDIVGSGLVFGLAAAAFVMLKLRGAPAADSATTPPAAAGDTTPHDPLVNP